MAFYSYKNTKILINGHTGYVQSAALSEQGSIEPSYLLDNKYSNSYLAENGIGGNLRLSYLLTGQDFLVDSISEEDSPLEVNFGGLTFGHGYLKSYSFGLSPNTPVIVDAEIVFFDTLSGSFNPSSGTISETQCLNVANAQIYNTPGNSIGTINNILNFNYTYQVDIQPQYNIGSTVPDRVVFGPKQIDCDFTTDKIQPFISVSGHKVSLRARLNHPQNSSIFQNFDCNGVLYQKDFGVSTNDILLNKFYIKQNDISLFNTQPSQNILSPIIYSFSPNTGYGGTFVIISGNNFNDVNIVSYFKNAYDYNFQIINNNQINSFVPFDAISGPITLYSPNGSVTSSKTFYVGGLPINISQVINNTGEIGSNVVITGENFYEISRVVFNDNQNSEFEVVNKNLINATVPDNCSWGYIKVISDIFSLTGQSPYQFVPMPKISGFLPLSGFSGDALLISGAGFSGVSGIKINNLPNNNTASFSIISNTGISVLVPSGNTKGFIRLYGQSGVSVLSKIEFYPYALITGITPLSGRVWTAVQLSGKNFIPEILYNFNSTDYAVSFQGGVTGYFKRASEVLLTGLVPSGAKSGIVNIYSPLQEQYPSFANFIVRNNNPTISSITPMSGKNQDYINIFGSDLADVSSMTITGNINGTWTGSNITTYSTSYTNDIINFRVPNVTGGLYSIIVNTIEGQTSGSGFRVLYDPYISGFSPISGGAGTQITITGLNIYPNISNVYINNTGTGASVISSSFTSAFDTIKFTLPEDIESGYNNLLLNNSVSTITRTGFYYVSTPIISGFLPLSGSWGTQVLVSGRYFNNVNTLTMGDLSLSFTKIGSTGIQFNISNQTLTNPIKLSTLFTNAISTGSFTVFEPPIFISGFTPNPTYYSSGLSISGSNIQTTKEIRFSGQNTEIVQTGFNVFGSTGIYTILPGGILDGQFIKLVNSSGSSYSSQVLNLIPDVQINSISNQTGYFKLQVMVSGANLDNSTPYLSSPNGNLVICDNIVRSGTTGLYFSIPSGVLSSPLQIKGKNDNIISTLTNFIVLPTISGLSGSYTYGTGTYLTITGINSFELQNYLVISGNNGQYYNIGNLNEFSGINKTGYSLINLKLNNNFAGTGKLFLVSSDDDTFSENSISSSHSFNFKNNILFNTNVTISQPAAVLTYINPTGGNDVTTITIRGNNLFSVNNILLVINNSTGTGIQTSTGHSEFNFTLPPNFVSGSGTLYIANPFGESQTGRFLYLQRLYISGYNPTQGYTGSIVTISGSGLLATTGVSIGDNNMRFSGGYFGSTYLISGEIPSSGLSCCGESLQICVKNQAESYCL